MEAAFGGYRRGGAWGIATLASCCALLAAGVAPAEAQISASYNPAKGGILKVVGDGQPQTLKLGCESGDVTVNGFLFYMFDQERFLPCKEPDSISVEGLGGDDVIDTTAVALPAWNPAIRTSVPRQPAHQVFLGGGRGQDQLRGGPLGEVLRGYDGEDKLFGGRGNDQLIGLNGDDLLRGGAGADELYPGIGADTAAGDDGDDLIQEAVDSAGNDRLYGGGGKDTIRDGRGRDLLSGGSGADSLFGGDARDLLLGFAGNDRLFGGPGNDALRGHGGNDFLRGGAGKDSLNGGPGSNDVHQ